MREWSHLKSGVLHLVSPKSIIFGNMRLPVIIMTILCTSVVGLFSQRASISTMSMMNPYEYVQAYGGFDRSLSATMMYRSQWSPLTGSPKYFHLNAHLPVYLFDGGMGVIFENEQLGAERNNLVKVSYNMVFNTQWGYFSAGASAGINQKNIDGNAFITPSGIYNEPVPEHNDPILNVGGYNATAPVWSISGLFKNDFLTAGLQIDNLVPFDYQFNDFEYGGNPVSSIFLSHQFEINDELLLSSTALVRTNVKIWQSNISAVLKYGNIFGGIAMRGYSGNSLESFGIISGLNFNNHYTIAYSYDLGLSALRNSTEGSHEIILKYNLNKILNTGLPPRIIYNPRDL